jgi:hypothetical protein
MPEGIPDVADVNLTSLKNLGQMRELVYVPLRDNERSFVEPWFVDAMLNEALLDLNARLRIKRASVSGTSDANGAIAIPSDFVEVTDLWFDDPAIQPELTNDAVFNSYAKRGYSSPANYLARVYGAFIQTYPQIESADYTLEYVARPTLLDLDTDRPTDLSPEMTPRLVAYAQAKAKWQEGETEEGNQYMAMYEAGLPGAPRMTNYLRPAPMTMFPAPGPFDA